MSSSGATNGEEPLMKRPKKKKKPSLVLRLTSSSSQSTPIPSLPDDLVISCFARISRLHYPALSLASKSFRSHLASPELYDTRSLLGRAESCLYVCLQFPPYSNPNPRWFTLCRKPDRMLTNDNNTSEKKKEKNKKKETYILVPIRVPKSPQTHWRGVVAVGSSIYSIGGPIDGSPSASVWVLDCHCHVWRKAPSLLVERENPAANVFDGKIYVAGGCRDFNSSNWIEVFDPKTQTWELVMCPLVERCKGSSIYKSAVVEGRIFYLFGNGGVAYKPEDGSWEAIGALTYLELGWSWRSYCVIDNVLFCFSDSDGFEWYDSKRQVWMNMRGLRGLPKFAGYGCVKMADYGGKLAVFWTKYFRASGYEEKWIWCAVIALERRKSDKEVWGTVEWIDPVLTIPTSFDFVRALSAMV